MSAINSIWDEYPPDYRQAEMDQLASAIRAGGCAAVVGLSGSGKSNLLGFFAHRAASPVRRVLLDANRLTSPDPTDFYSFTLRSLGEDAAAGSSFTTLEQAVGRHLEASPAGLCLVIDRFDACPGTLHGPLRSLRDAYKYRLTCVIGVRAPLDEGSELAELFNGHTLYLGRLSPADAAWSASSFARRANLSWTPTQVETLCSFSGAYPSFLRAACEAAAAGCSITPGDLALHPIFQRRLAEFRASQPPADLLRLSGLAGLPILRQPAIQNQPQLTEREQRLYAYLIAHPETVCGKEDLILAVWSEDRVYNQGLRDDSLAQLVRRLREKTETDPSNPQHIITIPTRGYIYRDNP